MIDQNRTVVADRLVREKERQLITQLSRTSAWNLERQGLFPRRRKLNPAAGGSSVCWLYSELMEFVNSREVVNLKVSHHE